MLVLAQLLTPRVHALHQRPPPVACRLRLRLTELFRSNERFPERTRREGRGGRYQPLPSRQALGLRIDCLTTAVELIADSPTQRCDSVQVPWSQGHLPQSIVGDPL